MKWALILTPETEADENTINKMIGNYHWDNVRIDDLRNREPHVQPQTVFLGQRFCDCLKVATAFGAMQIR
jgi:hypothetical protein